MAAASNGHGTVTAIRKERVAALSREGFRPVQISEMISGEGILNPQTAKPYSISTIVSDVSEMIGRNDRQPSFQLYKSLFTIDPKRTDYEWWDKFRSASQPGFEFSSLFARTVTETISFYVLGDEPLYTLAVNDLGGEDDIVIDDSTRDHTNRVIKKWVMTNLAQILAMLTETYALGDQFVFVNFDGTLTIPSPDTVKLVRSALNPEEIVEAVIYTRFEGLIIEEHFTAEKRTRIVRKGTESLTFEYDNLFGQIPMVHFANDRRSNELFGRVIYEALLYLFQAYNELLVKAIEGYRVMGNPIPTFSEVDNIDATIEANKPATPTTFEDGYGATESRTEMNFDTQAAVVTSGKFSLVTPPVGFSEDMRKVLKALFLLICDHTRIPEYMFGGAVEASKASTETQMPPFVSYITGKRIQFDGMPGKGGMHDLIKLVLKAKRLSDPGVYVGDIRSQYQDISHEDEQVRFQKLIYSLGNTLQPPVEVLTGLGTSKDPEKSIKLAESEAKRRMVELAPPDDFDTALNAAANKDMDPEENVQRPEGGSSAA